VDEKPAAAERTPIKQTIDQGRERVERSRRLLMLIDRMLGKKDDKSNRPH
jgi:hypothetical protein